MQTVCLTNRARGAINFAFMKFSAEDDEPSDISGLPLKARLSKQRGDKNKFAARMSISAARLTNWFSRGIPPKQFPKVCAKLGISQDVYRAEAGMPPERPLRAIQGDLDAASIIADLERLPPGLRAYVARKARSLREIWDNNPILHSVFTPPKDPAAYRRWEREVEGLIHRLAQGAGAGPDDDESP